MPNASRSVSRITALANCHINTILQPKIEDMRILLAASLLLLSTAGMAQKKGDPKKFAETITEADLKAHLYTTKGAD